MYRAVVDESLEANAQISYVIAGGAFLIAIIWFYVARAYRRRQGVAVEKRFQEIPVE